LALGVGANTAIFTLINQLLLEELPVRQPDQLVSFGEASGGGVTGTMAVGTGGLFSYDFYRQIEKRHEFFQATAASAYGYCRPCSVDRVCNLANFLLARTISREREISTRLALGSTRARIVGPILNWPHTFPRAVRPGWIPWLLCATSDTQLHGRVCHHRRMFRWSNFWSGGLSVVWIVVCVLMAAGTQMQAQTGTVTKVDKAHAGDKDTITFDNGDTLTGKVGKVVYGKVSFHSDELGDLTIPLTKIKTMHTAAEFAAASTTQRLTKKNIAEQLPVGYIALENETLKVMLPKGDVKEFPAKDIAFLLDEPAYQRELHNQSDVLYGWYGTVTLGAAVVKSTNSAQTYTGAVALVRAIPTIAGLPAGSKTILNLSGTYGLAKDPQIVSGDGLYQTASVTKTNILHGDLEYDKFFTPMVFGLVNASADHNFGNGLELQQAYGSGVGWGILRSPQNDLSVRASLQYEQQEFYNGITSGLGTPAENLLSASIRETWSRTFPHSLKFNESVTLNPTFNVVKAYSGAAGLGFVFPVYKNLNFSVTTTDNYLGDPPEGFLRNTFQFTSGVTYTLK
jgi:hypothetical protein